MNHNFVHLNYPLTHPGVDRAEQAVANFKRLGDNFSPTHTLAAMLLAAIVAAFVVVADQMMDTWADGHLLAGWVALWTVAFAALALLAPPLRQVSTAMASMFSTWARAAKLRRQEEAMWEYARRDPRVMAELQSAWTREHDEALPFDAVPTAR